MLKLKLQSFDYLIRRANSLEKTPVNPLTAMRCILKEISPEYSLEGLMLKQKLQYFGHLIRKS